MENKEANAELARIAMLEGQARVMRGMLIAVIAALDTKQRAKCASAMTVIWSDLQAELRPPMPEPNPDQRVHSTWNGANSAWNSLQSDLGRLLGG